MTSFKIHEDGMLAHKETILLKDMNKENKSRIPKKVVPEKRPALQSFNNGVRQESKRVKIGNKENVPPSSITDVVHANKEDKQKLEIDTDLLKIVPGGSKTGKNEEVANLFLSQAMIYSTEFSEDIWKYYKEMECTALPKPNYMEKQASITWNMRSVVVDWLVSVADEYTMSEDSLYLAVNYIDRFLSKISVVREKLQLVGASAMLIAGKMEEIYPPMPKEWAYLSGDCYTTRQIIKMEQLLVKVLGFQLQPPTSYTFVKKLCADHEMDEATMNLALYLTELVLLDGKHYLNFKPSEIAAASILYARFNLMKKTVWPPEIEETSGYTIKDLSPIVKAQSITLKDSPHKKQQAIQEKYKSPKFGRVALMKPRKISLNFLAKESEESEKISTSCELREESRMQQFKG